MLRQRLIFGTIVIGLIVALLVIDGKLAAGAADTTQTTSVAERVARNGLLCVLVVATISVLVARELLDFARARGLQPPATLATLLAVALVITPFVTYHWRVGGAWDALVIAAGLVAAFLVQGLRRTSAQALANIAATMFVAIYAGALPAFLVRLRIEVGGSAGATLLGLTVLAVKSNDIGAYFTGRAFGRHKLIEWLSPKKTWEGFIGGILTSIVATVGVGMWLRVGGLIPLNADWTGYATLAGFGLLMALLSVAGDLFASLLKRDAGVKDSGTGLPGLGGVIDMVDSPLLAAPFAWLFWTRLL